MKAKHGTLTRYELSLCQPLQTASGAIAQRSGLLLALDDRQGRRGYGDAAPLPGFSPDTLEEAEEALRAVLASAGPLRNSSFEGAAEIEALLLQLALPPSAAHALDQALLDLLAQEKGIPLCRLLADTCREHVPVHALVYSYEDASRAAADGFSCFKTKVGVRHLDEDDVRVRNIRRAIGKQGELRLDANGAWGDRTTALTAIERLARHGLQSVEQPVPADRIDLLVEVRAFSPVPIAADEAVRSAADLDSVIQRNAADAVVLKPMLCGGLQRTLALARRAVAAGLAVSVTGTFESSIGRVGALHVAAAVPGRLWSCGLASDNLLSDDLTPGPHASGGKLTVPVGPGLGVAIRAPGEAERQAIA
ncbi:MAG: o-succinylbenzoate synthase [Proteobacteria bacterium]|nr:o-succinylbenzoate synthase [Pseudomonadota bacterium]